MAKEFIDTKILPFKFRTLSKYTYDEKRKNKNLNLILKQIIQNLNLVIHEEKRNERREKKK